MPVSFTLLARKSDVLGEDLGNHRVGPTRRSPAESGYWLSTRGWAQKMRTRGGRGWYIRVSRGRDEVEAAVDACVRDAFLPGDVHLLLQELLVLFIDVLFNGLPAGGWEGSRWMFQKDRTRERILGMVPSHDLISYLH